MRYFFHVHDGKQFIDREGMEFASLDDARQQAIRSAGEMLREHGDFWTGDMWTMNVVDEHGITVSVLTFSAQ